MEMLRYVTNLGMYTVTRTRENRGPHEAGTALPVQPQQRVTPLPFCRRDPPAWMRRCPGQTLPRVSRQPN